MEIREIQAIVESLLFAAGEAVELEKIADIVDVDKKSLREIIKNFAVREMVEKLRFPKLFQHLFRVKAARTSPPPRP